MTVKILAPDGVLRSNVVFSTTSTSRFITGTVPEGTTDILVSLRGTAYSSDPTLVSFTGTEFIIPNPSSFPNGLDLFSGENIIGVQAVPLVGSPSAAATATIFLLSSDNAGAFPPPTGLSVERLDQAVRVSLQGLTDSRITGYNFYAATEPGGGAAGYSRINVTPVNTSDVVENVSTLYTLVSKNPVGDANPLFVRARIQQESSDETVLSTDVDSRVEIPDTVTNLQFNVTLSAVETVSYFRFQHDRLANEDSTPATIFIGEFASFPSDQPLYYTATALYYDDTTQVEYESYFSAELVASPINVRVQTVTLPAVSRQQILQDAITSIYRQNPNIGVQPGAVIRDTFLDPFSTEAERVRFIVDFLYRASSFDTLLQLDDPNNTGISIAPSNSAYKIALASAFFLSDPEAVQAIIDGAFDKLAANFSVVRPTGIRAIGEVRFYTPITPTQTLQIPLGTLVQGSGIQFRTTRVGELPADRSASFYNPATRLYSVTVPVQAVVPGGTGNLGPRQINSGAPYGFSVINDAATFGGSSAYTNAQLAALARGALSSVDTGTQQGYLQGAGNVPGVIQAEVVRAGSPFMLRDLDPATGTHLGGKVDVWTQGSRSVQVSDTFAFTYQRKRAMQFVVLGNPANYQFQALDPDLSESNPISQMLDYPSLGLGLKNVTTGEEFDLTGVTILNFNTIVLSSAVTQPAVTLTDVVLGDYRYRTGTRYEFSRQPVSYVASVVGEIVGSLGYQSFYLGNPYSPLGLGRSTRAGNYLQIVQSSDPTVVSPSGAQIAVSDELHVLTGFYTENLNILGADSFTVVVTDRTGTVTYLGPWSGSGVPDYDIIEGTATTPLGIRRTVAGTIPDGSSVLISYNHDENFVVTYQTNLVTAAVQEHLDVTEHATADALAKDGVQVPVEITATVVTQRGFSQSSVDQAIRANLQYLVSNLRMGSPLRRSDITSTIDNTQGVSYVIPLTTVARAAGSLVAYDSINVSDLTDTFRVDAWSTPTVGVWLLKSSLSAPTYDDGGEPGVFRGVFQNDVEMTLQSSTPSNLGLGANRCFIIGDGGLNIPGYTDDATLIADGFVTAADIASERQLRSQNRVLVSLVVGSSPYQFAYWATYSVASATGDNDIVTSSVEYIVLGNLTLSYDEDR